MTELARRCSNLKQRAPKIGFAWHLAEYLKDLQFVTRRGRPAKDNGTHITEDCQKTLGAGDCGALVDTAHRRTNDNVVVNRDKRQSRKSWKLVRQFACLRFAFAEPSFL
jgi:hypothetical protein